MPSRLWRTLHCCIPDPQYLLQTCLKRIWDPNTVETHLPYRELVANDLDFSQFDRVKADREWFIGVVNKVSELHVHTTAMRV